MVTYWILFLIFLVSNVTSTRPAFPIEAEEFCSGYGYNWAAEIRCLREMLSSCLKTNISDLLASQSDLDKTRGERSLPGEAKEYTDGGRVTPRKSFYNGYPSTGGETSAYTFPRRLYTPSYSPIYNRHNIYTTQSSPVTNTQSLSTCGCSFEELTRNLTKKLEKSIFEVKMGAQHECRSLVDEARKKAEDDLAAYQKMTDNDIRQIRKQLEWVSSFKKMHNGSEYVLIKRFEDWYSAEEYCLTLGGHLASIHDSIENSIIASMIPDESSAWISLNDVQKENKFINTDRTKSSYRSWMKGQPDNGNHNENCVEMNSSGEWSDLFCFVTRQFVCKIVKK